MKRILVVALLLLANLASAAPAERGRSMTHAQARAAVINSPTYKMIQEKRARGVDIRADKAVMDRISRVVELNVNGVGNLSVEQRSNLVKLLTINPADVMTEIARLASIAKDPANAQNARAKQMAATSLRLMAKASHNVQSLVVNSAQARTQEQNVKKILEISNKISELNFGEASQTFITKYERALTEGKTVSEAIRIASNGKFNETQLRECE